MALGLSKRQRQETVNDREQNLKTFRKFGRASLRAGFTEKN
jgi:hypothetical protein